MKLTHPLTKKVIEIPDGKAAEWIATGWLTDPPTPIEPTESAALSSEPTHSTKKEGIKK